MEQTSKLKPDSSALPVFILTAGVFGITNTEMGVIGILPEYTPRNLQDKFK